jgi:hypothetical protein
MIRNNPETGRDSGNRKTPIKNTPQTNRWLKQKNPRDHQSHVKRA